MSERDGMTTTSETERDELIDILRNRLIMRSAPDEYADAIMAAGYRKVEGGADE